MSDTEKLSETNTAIPALGFGDQKKLSLELKKGRDLLYRQAYFELCEIVTGRAPEDEPPPEEDFIKTVGRYLEDNRVDVHQKICVDFKWCEKRKKYGTALIPVPFLLSLMVFLADLKLMGLPTATWFAVTGLLDAFCKCHSKEQIA